jgi:CHAD domain-containing protein
MGQGHLEVEDKYDADADAEVTGLDALPGVEAVAAPVEHTLEATYHDTSDLRLARAGVTLRRRTGGDDEGWHLKLPIEKGRQELHEPVDAEAVPERFVDVVSGLSGGEPLRPVATIRTRRTVHRLLDTRGDAVAEVTDDQVTALRAGSAAPPRVWREWEVELAGGDDELLAAAAERLEGLGARPSSSGSKLARALGPDLPQRKERPWPGADEPACLLLGTRLREQVDALRRYDPAVRADLHGGVHRMRIAIRRIRSALATYRPLVDRDVTDPVREELKWLGGELGPARDTEVQRDRVRKAFDALVEEDPGLVRGTARTRAEAELTETYEHAHDWAVQALRSQRYAALLRTLDDLATAPPWSDQAERSVDDLARRRVKHDYKRLVGRVDEALSIDDLAHRGQALHDARKAAKRVRYAAEPLVPTYGKPAKRFVKAMKEVASTLGDHHDAIVADDVLRDLGDAAAAKGEHSFTFGVLQARETERAREEERRFEQVWSRASRKKLRRWLG